MPACLITARAEIDDGALANKGLEIAWAADPVDLFFVEIQGSGRVVFPDGTSIRIGYGEQNGLPYTAIGKLLRDRNILPPGGASMQSIKAWIAANPDQGRELMRENASYIFFKELDGPGPVGSLNVPLTPRGSVAADPKFVPLGAPVYLAVDRPEAYGLWVAQDVGGAIKGSNRFDTFWGGGPRPRRSRAEWLPTGSPTSCSPREWRPVRSLNPDEAELWARVASTIRPLSREKDDPQPLEPAPQRPLESHPLRGRPRCRVRRRL